MKASESGTFYKRVVIYSLYIPRTEDEELLFRDGKGSEAALEGAYIYRFPSPRQLHDLCLAQLF